MKKFPKDEFHWMRVDAVESSSEWLALPVMVLVNVRINSRNVQKTMKGH